MGIVTGQSDRVPGTRRVEISSDGPAAEVVTKPAPPKNPVSLGQRRSSLAYKPGNVIKRANRLEPDLAPCFGVVGQVRVGVDEARQKWPPAKLHDLRFRADEICQLRTGSDRDNTSMDDSQRVGAGRIKDRTASENYVSYHGLSPANTLLLVDGWDRPGTHSGLRPA
jgi:hypothetical protein